jgi:hypothetical protein
MVKSRMIKFRVDEGLYESICAFASDKGITNISELMRMIIIMHFMGIMLGHFPDKPINEMMDEFLKKYDKNGSHTM